MRVVLVLKGYLSWYTPGKVTEIAVDAAPGMTIRQAAVQAGLPEDQVAMAIVDDEQRDLDQAVADEQRIVLLPPIDGG